MGLQVRRPVGEVAAHGVAEAVLGRMGTGGDRQMELNGGRASTEIQFVPLHQTKHRLASGMWRVDGGIHFGFWNSLEK